jgi:hypothetical protein
MERNVGKIFSEVTASLPKDGTQWSRRRQGTVNIKKHDFIYFYFSSPLFVVV